MSCLEIINVAAKEQARSKMDCPVRIYPHCHPKAHLEIHVDGKMGVIYFSCSKCDRLMSIARVRK